MSTTASVQTTRVVFPNQLTSMVGNLHLPPIQQERGHLAPGRDGLVPHELGSDSPARKASIDLWDLLAP